MKTEIGSLLGLILKYPLPWILTGAGISTESGIPDFRSPGTGLWEKVDPMEFSSVEGLLRNPRKFFSFGRENISTVLQALPNTGHIVLGNLQQAGLIGPIVTQNIDDLHRRGGAFHFYEVHGHFRTASCMNCRRQVPIAELMDKLDKDEIPPLCEYCRGILKPDVVLFGDMMAPDYQEASILAGINQTTPRMMIVIGSSLTVAPACYLPLDFHRLVIINNTPTGLDYRADLVIQEQIGNTMDQLWREILDLNDGLPPQPIRPDFNCGYLAGYLDSQFQSLPKDQGQSTEAAVAQLQADFQTGRDIIKAFGKADLQALERSILSYLDAELELLQANLHEQFGVPTDQAVSRLGNVARDLFHNSMAALAAYSQQSSPQPAVMDRLAAKAAGDYSFWSRVNQVMAMPEPPSAEWEGLQKLASENNLVLNKD